MDIDVQKFEFKRSSIAKFYLGVFIAIFALFFYLSNRNSIIIGQLITAIFLAATIYLLLYKKTVIVNGNDRSITVKVDVFGLVASKVLVQGIPSDAVIQYKDEYQTHQRGATCWLSIDLKTDDDVSVLPLSVQKKLKEHSQYNRKVLTDVAKFVSNKMGLPLQDLRSARYRD